MRIGTRILLVVFSLAAIILGVAMIGHGIGLTRGHPSRYTCRDIWGVTPKPGNVEVLPPGWSVSIIVTFGGGPVAEDFRAWDERGRLVCDEKGRDIVPPRPPKSEVPSPTAKLYRPRADF